MLLRCLHIQWLLLQVTDRFLEILFSSQEKRGIKRIKRRYEKRVSENYKFSLSFVISSVFLEFDSLSMNWPDKWPVHLEKRIVLDSLDAVMLFMMNFNSVL